MACGSWWRSESHGSPLPTAAHAPARHLRKSARPTLDAKPSKEITMPIILWLLGVPLGLVLLLMLFGVI